MSVLGAIDRLIDEQLMPRRCRAAFGRSRCACGHISLVHERISHDPREPRGNCSGKGCRCRLFTPHDYASEQRALRRKYRRFALALLRETRR